MKIQNREYIKEVKLLESDKFYKRERNIAYLLELKTDNLLFPYYTEAGLNGHLHYKLTDVHWGWDSPLSQIRGTFTGHWLSAAARIYQETGNLQLKIKADFIVTEMARCQEENGGEWVFAIPEKYLYAVKNGKHFWAPQYVCHKTMMGLLDMYLFADNKKALEIVEKCAIWFNRFSEDISRETMDMMMDNEETGAIMELWADLYAITQNPMHLELVRRYERPKVTAPILEGKDVLTNMHANTTIPEIHGCARAYEVTGEERFRKIVENYWNLAVTKRGRFATGGQTDGEMWTPMMKQAARLSEVNQEHCSVYNMIRMANYLFRWSGKVEYLDYIEQNIENGIMAQGFWEDRALDTRCEKNPPDTGLIAYFLPLAAGSQKKWGSKTEDFWCCHCTLLQANAKFREYVFYESDKELTIAQYIPAELKTKFEGIEVNIRQIQSDLTGPCLIVNDISTGIKERPKYNQYEYEISSKTPIDYTIKLRIPWWIQGEMEIDLNGERISYQKENGFAIIKHSWQNDKVIVKMPKSITCWPLADEENTVAFLDGPIVLAGLVPEERILIGDIKNPETLIAPHDEREWDKWMPTYKTVNQMRGFYLKPIKDIGNQKYSVYFPVKKKH